MTSYTNIFGGGVISPAQAPYVSYTLTGSLTLVWPQETAVNSNLAAQLVEISVATAASYTVNLPPANLVSLGQWILVNNKSAFTQTISDNAGNVLIGALAAGAIYFLYITNNATAAGTWSSFQYGAAISAPNASALAGAGLQAVGATLAQNITVTSLNTTPYTSGINDRAKLLNWTGASGTFNLPLAATVGASWYVQIRNNGTSTLTAQLAGSDVINGGSAGGTLTFNPGDSAFVVTDGTSWYTIGFGTSVSNAFKFLSISVPAVISGTIVTLTGAQLNQVAYKFTGALVANTIIDLPAYAQQYWVDNETSGAFSLTVQVPTVIGGGTAAGTVVAVPQGTRYILYADGTNVLNASTATVSGTIAIAQGGTGATTASAARANLGSTTVGDAVFIAASASAAQTAMLAASVADATVLAMVF